MSVKHNTLVFFVFFLLLSLLTACGGGAKKDSGENDVTLYISLGPSSGFPENSSDQQDNIFFYWGRSVIFSAQGIDDVNSSIELSGKGVFDWTGFAYDDGTLYASHTFTLEDDSKDYPGGLFKFKMFIDWNDNNILDEGDVYLSSYNVYADQDQDAETEVTKVDTDNWGSHISYIENDEALIVDDPLDASNGTPWLVRRIGEGDLEVWE